MRLCLDAAGDECIIPDTAATIAVGIGTATDGSVAYKVDAPFAQVLSPPGNGNLYLFVKGASGTLTLDRSTLTWSE